MRKLTTLAAILAATTLSLLAENPVAAASFLSQPDTTVTTNYLDLADYSIGYREITKVVAKNNGAQTATSVVAICDEPASGLANAAFTALATYALATSTHTNDFPLRAGAYGSINSSAVPYSARKLRVITTLAATNTVQAAVDFYIYGRK